MTSICTLMEAKEEEAPTSGLLELPRFPVKSDFCGVQIPTAISSRLRLLAALLKSKI